MIRPRLSAPALSVSVMALVISCTLVLTAPALAGGSLAGQGLAEVERLALDGQAEQARELLSDWWEPGFEGAGRGDRQLALWLRGLLTVDPAMAELDFQRLMVEYPGTPYAARAIVRLARAAEARGRTAEAADYFRRLVRGYPESAQEQTARGWLERRGLPLETRSLPTEAPEGRWAIQFGAFSSEARALTLLEEMRDLGHDVRMVRVSGSPLFRIRMGRFRTEEAVMREMSGLRESGLDVTVVSNADRESR